MTYLKLPEAPKLAEMRVTAMSIEQLQASLVQLIDLHNKLEASISAMLRNGQILSPSQASSKTVYGI